MSAFLQKCKRCQNQFVFVPGKLFCHKVCRNTYYREARSHEDLVINSLPVIEPSQDLAHKFVDQPANAPARFIIQSNAPERAVAFRLGVMNSGARRSKNPRMKWFPHKPFRTPAVYSIAEWDTIYAPFAGSYAVAYFDEDCLLIEPPTFQVNIRAPAIMFSWCAGDDQITLDPRNLQ